MKTNDNKKGKSGRGGDDTDYVEVGEGRYCVVTVDRRDGSAVVQRFRTKREARAQHRRNVAADKPMAGIETMN